MKVDFVIAGTQKGGTSALDKYLRGHPDICMAKQKEVHFFDNDDYFSSGSPDYGVYHRYFKKDHRRQDMVLGEATPIYMYWRAAPERIFTYNPKMKIIILLRNPIERAYSHWNMERGRDNRVPTFRESLERERARGSGGSCQHRRYSYVDRGRYSNQITRILRFFPADQVLLLRSDELSSQPEATLSRIHGFIDVSRIPIDGEIREHSRPYATHMSFDEWRYLRAVFEKEVELLERLTGWDCSDWLQPPPSTATES